MKHLVNVHYRLPVQISPEGGIDTVGGGISAALDSIRDDYEVWWIGWPGRDIEDEEKRADLSIRLKQEYKFIPIFMSKEEESEFIHGFAGSSLLPLMHYISTQTSYNDEWFETFYSVSERIAMAVIEHARPGDMIWVHDYHLMLLPSLIKKKQPELKVGFFFHTPFPSFELFRCHPRREELLKGVMGADLIGFHTFGYLRHFRSTVLRLLGLESQFNMLNYKGFATHIGVHPIGINWNGLQKTLKSTGFKANYSEYKKLYKNKNLVLSVGHLTHAQGFQLQLQAIEKFLEENDSYRENTTFLIIAQPSREEILDYEHFQHDVEHAVGRINGKFSTIQNIPIQFLHKRLDHDELCALYSLANVALITPLMDGMNLVAKEFIACQNHDPGVLILSEFAGAAQELYGSVKINPYNINEITRAILGALNMPPARRLENIEVMKSQVMKRDSYYWARTFLQDLDQINSISPVMASKKGLDNKLIERFRKSKDKKALFLDYDGTLREFVADPEAAVPAPDLLETFAKFDKRDDLDVYIISGRNTDFLEKHFGSFGFTLIGEHGYYLKKPGKPWGTLVAEVDMSWKDKILDIFDLHTRTTPGSKVEEKNSAIVWHYRNSDPEFGNWKAGELIGELTEAISNLPVEIHHGKKIIEVSSQHVNKGVAVGRFVSQNDYREILCAGDDKTDETMFHFDDAVTIKIGDQETNADYRVATPKKFRAFLAAIA